MQDINKVALVGRLTRDIELSYTSGGMAIGKGSIAVSRSQKKNGNWENTVSFFDITMFGKMAENLKPYLQKGKQIVVGGYLKQDRWNGQDGSARSKVTIVVEECQLCGDRKQSNDNGSGYEDGYGTPDEYGN